jgi:hypothetical protein
MTLKPRVTAVALCVAAFLIAACGGQASLLPTSPSRGGGEIPAGGGAVITGTVNGMPQAALASDAVRAASNGTLIVTVAGTNISTAVDGNNRFTLTGVPNGTIRLELKGRGIDAAITIAAVSAGDRIDITLTVVGAGVRVDNEHREVGDSGTEIEGLITAIDASRRTIRVRDRLIEVPSTARIRRGGTRVTFGDLRVGDRVHVKATLDGTRVIAREVRIQGDDDDFDGIVGATEVRGAVSSLGDQRLSGPHVQRWCSQDPDRRQHAVRGRPVLGGAEQRPGDGQAAVAVRWDAAGQRGQNRRLIPEKTEPVGGNGFTLPPLLRFSV